MVSIEPQLVPLLLTSYEGDMHQTRCHGAGKGVFSSGVVYEGTWDNGVMHGSGILRWPDGVVYEGDVQQNKLTGRGKYTWPDGSQYEGDVQDGLRHGQGVFTAATKERYEGEWKNGLRHGFGILWYNEERTAHYKGEWQDGQRHGHGVLVYLSGASYDGTWAHNRKNGTGIMQWPATNERYRGEWLDDYQHGFGEHVWVENRPERTTVGIDKQMCNIYRGHWCRGERCGHGVFFYSDGSQYSGQWDGNLKHGYGVHIFADGRMYEGQLYEDRIVHTYNITTKSGEVPPFFKLHIQDIVQTMGPTSEQYEQEILAIEKLLLRYQSDIKLLYKQYTLQSKRSQYIFSMRLRQFWQFLYECSIMPQITATEVGLCLRDMHKQQAHLLWVNHSTTVGQNDNTSPERMVESPASAEKEAAADYSSAGCEQSAQACGGQGDIVFDDGTDDEEDESAIQAQQENESDAPERSASSYEAKLHDVYEVHRGGDGSTTDCAAYLDPDRPILLREFAELLVRVCARYTQRYFEGQGGLYACISVLFEHKIKPLAQQNSKVDHFTRTFFSREFQEAVADAVQLLHAAFANTAGDNEQPIKNTTSVRAVLSWARRSGWIAVGPSTSTLLQAMQRCKGSNRSGSTVMDPTALLTPCVFIEFMEILCRLLDSEHWVFPKREQQQQTCGDENPETSIPVNGDTTSEDDTAAAQEGLQHQSQANDQTQHQEQDAEGNDHSTEAAADPDVEPQDAAAPPQSLLEKLQVFLQQQLPNAVDT